MPKSNFRGIFPNGCGMRQNKQHPTTEIELYHEKTGHVLFNYNHRDEVVTFDATIFGQFDGNAATADLATTAEKDLHISAAITEPPTAGELTTANNNVNPAAAGAGYGFLITNTGGTGASYFVRSNGAAWVYVAGTNAA